MRVMVWCCFHSEHLVALGSVALTFFRPILFWPVSQVVGTEEGRREMEVPVTSAVSL